MARHPDSPLPGVSSTAQGKLWPYFPGDWTSREDLHASFGGRLQGRISPSSKVAAVFLFLDDTDPLRPPFEGLAADGCYHVMGEGRRGAQTVTQGNKALLLSAGVGGGTVRLFGGIRGRVRYLGRFTLDETTPLYEADSPDEDGDMRTVLVFRLRPCPGEVDLNLLPKAHRWQPERLHYPARNGQGEKVAEILHSYEKYLVRNLAVPVSILDVKPSSEMLALTSDLFDEGRGEIIKAVPQATREAVRYAVGSLLDLARLTEKKCALAVLSPKEPREDLVSYLRSLGISVIFQDGTGGFLRRDA